MLGALLLAGALASGAATPKPADVPPTPAFRQFGVAEGLPSASAYGVVQDQRGYLWIGTRDGLARYDARTFEVLRHDPADPASLPANDVSALLVGRKGTLWVGGEGTGLERLRADGHGFDHWMHDAKDPGSLDGNDVMSLAQGPDGSIWVGVYGGGLNRLRPGAKAFTHWRHRAGDPASLASDAVTALAFDAHGALWIGTDAGLQRMDRHDNLAAVALPGTSAPASVWQVQVYKDGLDVATSAGLFRIDFGIDGVPANTRRIGAPGQTLASLRGRDGVWIGRGDALEFIDANGGVRRYTHQSGRRGSLPGNLPMGIFRDREGGLWVALLDGGLAYLAPGRRAFSDWQHVPGEASSLAVDRVRALARAADGQLWVGGPDGALDLLDPAKGAVQHFADAAGLASSSISALAVDAEGRVWIGHRHGLRLLDGTRARDISLGGAAQRHGVWALLAARDGSIYVAVNGGGVLRIDGRTFDAVPMTLTGLAGDGRQIDHLMQASDGTIWASGPPGVLRLSPGATAFAKAPGIADGRVDAFAFASDGSLWAAREDALQHYRLDAAGAHLVASVDAAHGWPVVESDGMAVDAAGNVLVTTPRGLVRYVPGTRQLYLFTTRDGMASAAFTAGMLVPGADGMLFAGSLDGVIAIRPRQLQPPLQSPLPVLASLRVRRGDSTIALDPDAPVRLRWNDRELTVGADALSFIDPAHNRYRFRLQPFDPDWVETGERNVREFSELHAGNYTLAISVATATGAWSTSTAPLRINVAAPPWATPWAYAAYVVAALLLVWLIVWLTRRHLRQQHRYALGEVRQRMAEQANAAKSRFLANMAHEIRTPLTGVLGMTELLMKTPLNERQNNYADAIRRSGALLLRQVNDALDVARIEAGRLELNPAPFDPAALLREVAEADAGLAAQKQIGIEVVVAPDVPAAVRGDALRVQQILFNLVHNAIKFSVNGDVVLQLEREPGGIRYSVKDSGPGMTPEECARIFQRFEQADHGRLQRGSGLGLAISRELVNLMGGRIDVQSLPGHGSTFSVHLPLTSVTSGDVAPTDPKTTSSPARPHPHVVAPAAAVSASAARVLLVEDDPVAGQAIAGLIESFGHQVTLAPQALAALAEIDVDGAFDAMVFDFDLPGMDGCELAQMLRQRGITTPIVALTASAHGDEERRAREAGMDAFLRKPVLPEDLRNALEQTMQQATL